MSYRKIELSDKDVKLLKESANHWKKDIVDKLKEGLLIIIDRFCSYPYKELFWVKNLKTMSNRVECYSDTCPLCKEYLIIYHCCDECPYKRFYGVSCDDSGGISHWHRFIHSPTLRNAMAMENALRRIIKYRKTKNIKKGK